jgi:hypothetical protein
MAKKKPEHTCEADVWERGSFHSHTCGKAAVFHELSGWSSEKAPKWFCKMHAPSQKKLREDKRGPTKWERELADERVTRAAQERRDVLLRAVIRKLVTWDCPGRQRSQQMYVVTEPVKAFPYELDPSSGLPIVTDELYSALLAATGEGVKGTATK